MCYSAKVSAGNEITPESNYVYIENDGNCTWVPRYDMSVTQCHVDVAWFPFDTQMCDLVFESWILPESILKLKADNDSVYLDVFREPEGWQLFGACSRCKKYYVHGHADCRKPYQLYLGRRFMAVREFTHM